jgi:hypothetical protein
MPVQPARFRTELNLRVISLVGLHHGQVAYPYILLDHHGAIDAAAPASLQVSFQLLDFDPELTGYELSGALLVFDRFAVEEDIEGRAVLDKGQTVPVKNGAPRRDNLDRAHPVALSLLRIIGSLQNLELPEPRAQQQKEGKHRIEQKVQPLLNQLLVAFRLETHFN